MQIRPIHQDECEELGRVTVRSYRHLAGGEPLGSYEEVLKDVRARMVDCEVLVALNEEGEMLGGVTYVPGPGTSMSEFTDPEAAGIRHLAVDPSHQGSGAGHALVVACIERARGQLRRRVRLHSTPPMVIARAMYERLGFVHVAELDVFYGEEPYSPDEPLHLMAYALSLDDPSNSKEEAATR
jgi:ribosomal protein S18 acetylase RimI-like enzyme